MVTLYTTHCPKCNVLEKKLQLKHIQFNIIDDENIMQEKGMVSAPCLEVGNELKTFKEAITWVDSQG